MARNSVRGTPYTHISNTAREGYGSTMGGKTVQPQYQGSGINTRTNERGTPYNSQEGNSDEFKRVVSHDKYGMVESNEQGNANDPKNNGSGVVLDGARYANGFSPNAHPAMDSPVPTDAPRFDPGFIGAEDAAHLGSGNERGRNGLVAGDGVMSRGMVGVSKNSQPETFLTEDDTLPSTGPAGKA
jgi:hypothetical protein